MFQILALSLQAMKAIAQIMFASDPAEEKYRAARARAEQLRSMGW